MSLASQLLICLGLLVVGMFFVTLYLEGVKIKLLMVIGICFIIASLAYAVFFFLGGFTIPIIWLVYAILILGLTICLLLNKYQEKRIWCFTTVILFMLLCIVILLDKTGHLPEYLRNSLLT